LKAENVHGYGPYSGVQEVIPSYYPLKMGNVVTTIENIYVKIAFPQGDENGSTITAYRILIQHKDGLNWLESDNC
jgi:hypothetical protein